MSCPHRRHPGVCPEVARLWIPTFGLDKVPAWQRAQVHESPPFCCICTNLFPTIPAAPLISEPYCLAFGVELY
jgi:hypothetical protein